MAEAIPGREPAEPGEGRGGKLCRQGLGRLDPSGQFVVQLGERRWCDLPVHGGVSSAKAARHPDNQPWLSRQESQEVGTGHPLAHERRPADNLDDLPEGGCQVLVPGEGLERCRLALDPRRLGGAAHHLDDVAVLAQENLGFATLGEGDEAGRRRQLIGHGCSVEDAMLGRS
jgi:hypothetical protein